MGIFFCFNKFYYWVSVLSVKNIFTVNFSKINVTTVMQKKNNNFLSNSNDTAKLN